MLSVYFNYEPLLPPALKTAVSLGALVGDIVFFSLGLGAIPWLLVSEVRVRGPVVDSTVGRRGDENGAQGAGTGVC